jgi:glycosyltransferase involved in cell wall biosynthesis
MEVLAIDDASTDDTPAVLARYEGSRVRIIRHAANQGHIGTVTEGLTTVQGKFVSRIDPDDRLRPGYLKRVIPILEAHPEVGLVYGDAALIDQAGRVTADSTDAQHRGADFKGNEFVALLARNFICAPTVMARREAWLGALPVPEGLAFNDWHFTTMMARRYEFYYLHEALADYRVHSANMHTQISVSRTEEPSVLRLLDRYFSEEEVDAGLERAKRAAKRSIYATRYLEFARKYFGQGDAPNARRCYLSAIRFDPRVSLRPDVLRQCGATLLGLERYGRLKRFIARHSA